MSVSGPCLSVAVCRSSIIAVPELTQGRGQDPLWALISSVRASHKVLQTDNHRVQRRAWWLPKQCPSLLQFASFTARGMGRTGQHSQQTQLPGPASFGNAGRAPAGARTARTNAMMRVGFMVLCTCVVLWNASERRLYMYGNRAKYKRRRRWLRSGADAS